MKFIRLLLAEAGDIRWRLVGSVVLSGTAMALIILQIPNNFLPIFQR